MNSPVLVFLAVSVICISIGCSPKAAETMQTNTATYAANIKPLHSENGKRFEKEDGWEIPRLGSGRLEKEYFFQTTTDTGEKIKVAVTDYDTSSPDTEEPFKSIGQSLGLIHVRYVKAFAVDGQRFCYRVQANRVGHGSVFPFSFYNEDGDGKFETLLLDEKDEKGAVSFSSPPHIPRWIRNLERSSKSTRLQV